MPARAEDSYQRYDAYSKLLDRNGHWIEVADTKAAIVLAFLIAVFPTLMAPILPAAGRLIGGISRHAGFWVQLPTMGFITLLAAFLAFALYTLVHVLLALTPRLKRAWKPSLVFFGDVAAMECEKWQQLMLARDPNGLATEVLEQVYATACIADQKHRYVRRAIRGVLGTVLLGLVLYVLSQLAR